MAKPLTVRALIFLFSSDLPGTPLKAMKPVDLVRNIHVLMLKWAKEFPELVPGEFDTNLEFQSRFEDMIVGCRATGRREFIDSFIGDHRNNYFLDMEIPEVLIQWIMRQPHDPN